MATTKQSSGSSSAALANIAVPPEASERSDAKEAMPRSIISFAIATIDRLQADDVARGAEPRTGLEKKPAEPKAPAKAGKDGKAKKAKEPVAWITFAEHIALKEDKAKVKAKPKGKLTKAAPAARAVRPPSPVSVSPGAKEGLFFMLRVLAGLVEAARDGNKPIAGSLTCAALGSLPYVEAAVPRLIAAATRAGRHLMLADPICRELGYGRLLANELTELVADSDKAEWKPLALEFVDFLRLVGWHAGVRAYTACRYSLSSAALLSLVCEMAASSAQSAADALAVAALLRPELEAHEQELAQARASRKKPAPADGEEAEDGEEAAVKPVPKGLAGAKRPVRTTADVAAAAAKPKAAAAKGAAGGVKPAPAKPKVATAKAATVKAAIAKAAAPNGQLRASTTMAIAYEDEGEDDAVDDAADDAADDDAVDDDAAEGEDEDEGEEEENEV